MDFPYGARVILRASSSAMSISKSAKIVFHLRYKYFFSNGNGIENAA